MRRRFVLLAARSLVFMGHRSSHPIGSSLLALRAHSHYPRSKKSGETDGEGRGRRANEENETLDEMNKTRRLDETRRLAEMIRMASKQRDA